MCVGGGVIFFKNRKLDSFVRGANKHKEGGTKHKHKHKDLFKNMICSEVYFFVQKHVADA